MNPILTVSISIVVSTLIAAFGSFWAFRIQFERFLARDSEREKHWDEWRQTVNRDVEQLKAERNFDVRIQHVENFIDELRDWKHEAVEPYIRAMGLLKDRVDRLEKAP
ncbi:MAG: hypothetical protein ACRCTG_13870 [Aestuariivirga sp.]